MLCLSVDRHDVLEWHCQIIHVSDPIRAIKFQKQLTVLMKSLDSLCHVLLLLCPLICAQSEHGLNSLFFCLRHVDS